LDGSHERGAFREGEAPNALFSGSELGRETSGGVESSLVSTRSGEINCGEAHKKKSER